MKLRIYQSGQAPVDVVVEKDELVFGRSSDCDVVLSSPYISKCHVKLLRGLVVHDLESINGTFMDQKRVSGPQLLVGKSFSIGPEDVRIEILEGGLVAPEEETAELKAVKAENAGLLHQLEELRAQNEFLQLQIDNLKPEGESTGESESRERRDKSIQELESLQRRYAELLGRLNEEIDDLLEPAGE